ncbi:MAG: Gfo/Idh/MocA family oxidoreductase [Acidobacteriaceae bacterium]
MASSSLMLPGWRTVGRQPTLGAVRYCFRTSESKAAHRDQHYQTSLADPDDTSAARIYGEFPKAARYKDFRKLFDRETNNIDAVIVSTPDHMHATAAMWAMERGKHMPLCSGQPS